jgi:hypothetical protein
MNQAYDVSYPVTVTGGRINITTVYGDGVPILDALAIVGVQ